MSIDYRTYVGPYVRCAVGVVSVTKERRSCANPACPGHQEEIYRAQFCQRCGSPIGKVPYTKTKDAVDAWYVIEAIDQRLTDASGDGYSRWVEQERAHIYIANVGIEGRSYHLEENADFALAEITPNQLNDEMAAFAGQFADEIAKLREMYSTEAVSLHWGILQDYS